MQKMRQRKQSNGCLCNNNNHLVVFQGAVGYSYGMSNTIGEKIIALRKLMGYTRKQLADIIGVHPEQLRHWEKGIRNPKIEALERIASACDIDVRSLLNPEIPVEELKYHTIEYYVPFSDRTEFYLTDANYDEILAIAIDKNMELSSALNYVLDKYFAH